MYIYKNKSIIGSIVKVIKAIFNFIYKIFSFLNLQYALFIAVVGVILWVLGIFQNYPISFTIFIICLAVSIVLSVVITIRKIFVKKDDNKKEKRGKVEIVVEKQNNTNNNYNENTNSNINSGYTEQVPPQSNIPKYYKVSQNENYIMAEYSDRYELFVKTANGLKKVRTDYKR